MQTMMRSLNTILSPLSVKDRAGYWITVSIPACGLFVIAILGKMERGPVENSPAGLGILAALGVVLMSFGSAVSWFIVRPDPPGKAEGLMYQDPLPAWWTALKPLVLLAVVFIGPLNWWALARVVGAFVVFFVLELWLRPVKGSHVEFIDRIQLAMKRGGYVCTHCGRDLPVSPPGPSSGRCICCNMPYEQADLIKAWQFPPADQWPAPRNTSDPNG